MRFLQRGRAARRAGSLSPLRATFFLADAHQRPDSGRSGVGYNYEIPDNGLAIIMDGCPPCRRAVVGPALLGSYGRWYGEARLLRHTDNTSRYSPPVNPGGVISAGEEDAHNFHAQIRKQYVADMPRFHEIIQSSKNPIQRCWIISSA